MTNSNPELIWRGVDVNRWEVTEHAGKVFQRLTTWHANGTVYVTVEFTDGTELSLQLEMRPVASFETVRNENGTADIAPCMPTRQPGD